ncbi:rifin [Plasmodium reichenowi]|uniref:Rifin n=1 Tax=Plasmodium reichenowi TaxID=5854 RepID=A0A060RMH3_PLARE|nr:rifin [Plasmodium reichenowi]
MKVHYINILLFALPLNILLTSYHVYSKNKPSITSHHTPRYTSRVLSECDTESSIYDNDEEMKSVKEIFERQTSQRFEEYQERMKEKRQKRKEQRDKNIQKIIHKDKMGKNLAEKIEKGCLMCGCGLGSVAGSVGLFGGLGTYGWKIGASAAAMELATKKGIQAGIDAVISAIKKKSAFSKLKHMSWSNYINGLNYSNDQGLFNAVMEVINSTGATCASPTNTIAQACNGISTNSKYWISTAVKAGKQAAADATVAAEEAELAKVSSTSSYAYSAIGYSVLAILIIVLVMVIIYLILRYRRKKKMKRKGQYTKLLNK